MTGPRSPLVTPDQFGPNRSEAEMVAAVFGALTQSPAGPTIIGRWCQHERPLALVDWRLFWAPLRDEIWTHVQGAGDLWHGYEDLCDLLGFDDPVALQLPIQHVKNSYAWSTDRLEVNVIRQVGNSEIDAAFLLRDDGGGRLVQMLEAKWEDDLQPAKGRHGLNQVQRQAMLALWIARHYGARVQLTFVGASTREIRAFARHLSAGDSLEPVWRRVRAALESNVRLQATSWESLLKYLDATANGDSTLERSASYLRRRIHARSTIRG